MTTPIARDASGAAVSPPTDSWCTDCDGRPSRQLETFPAGNPRALTEADQLAATAGPGAHVHFAARRDEFVVVVPAAVAA
ncbi:hypothetical protein ABT246_37825 [Streptomyces sp. NPDC001553]|uniref:hypothetical protein n=1 Tax=Streptomyces sp. NPDC001553 TaxID=3154385 RepID=UPI003331D3E7